MTALKTNFNPLDLDLLNFKSNDQPEIIQLPRYFMFVYG